MATVTETHPGWGDNPYIGPRTFSPAEAHKFFGRNREARNLIGMIVSHRTMLFYAQSGAGKSSLINAKVIPGLTHEGFEMLPVGRVSGQNGLDTDVENIFVYNLISSLHRKKEEPPIFSSITLSAFLDNLVQIDGVFAYDDQYVYPEDAELKPRVLLIDQFEEILTTNTPFWEERDVFFQQLGEAMALDDQLWVVMAMREDFIAGLDPYRHHFENGLRDRFYMQQLDREAALEAIMKPAEGAKRPFTPHAAEILVDNLREIRQRRTVGERFLGAYVEPVQLQAVCYQMWEKLKEHPGGQITVQDVEAYADVNEALINFYEDTIADTVANTDVSEPDLRKWFDVSLITQAGTRNMVYRGNKTTGELPTPIADYVKGKFILRENVRPGGIWYELVHDRFVKPILKANREWRKGQPLIRLAERWVKADRDAMYLLGRRQLAEYTKRNENWKALGPLIIAYAETSQKALAEADALEQEEVRQQELEQQRALAAAEQTRAEEAEKAAVRQKRLARVAIGVGIFALIASIVAFILLGFAQKAADYAVEQADAASAAQRTAESGATYAAEQSTVAFEAQSTAEADRDIASTAEAEANANREQLVIQIDDMMAAQAMAEEQANELSAALATQAALLEQLLAITATPYVIEITGTPVPGRTPSPIASLPLMQDLTTQLGNVRATQTAVAASVTAPQTVLIGISNRAVPIEAIRFGNGANKIVLVGGMHSGWAPGTVEVAEDMIEYFTENGQDIPEEVSLYVIPEMNPDSVPPDSSPPVGQLPGRLNANGVDLNRNWDCNWSSDPYISNVQVNGAGGKFPVSETESLALSNFLQEIKPTAVILWYAPSREGLVEPGGCPKATVSLSLAELYAEAAGYSYYESAIDDITEGDASNWLDSIGIPAISVVLPDYEDADFERNLTAVYALLDAYSEQ